MGRASRAAVHRPSRRPTIKFKKPDDHSYTAIEELAHGQRCTAILVILLADGDTPALVDQPEDALHAPWIEEYLVDRCGHCVGVDSISLRRAAPASPSAATLSKS